MAPQTNKVNPAALVGVVKKPLTSEGKDKAKSTDNVIDTQPDTKEQISITQQGKMTIAKTSEQVQPTITSPDDLTNAPASLKTQGEDKTYWVVETQFEVDLDHKKTGPPEFQNTTIILTASIVLGDKEEKRVETTGGLIEHLKKKMDKKITVFLCGGPGASNPPDRNPEFNDEYLKDGGCIIFLDYRGTGKSILQIRDQTNPELQEEWNKHYVPLLRPPYKRSDPEMAMKGERAKKMAGFLTLFRHDDIVRDLEAIRLCLFGPDKKWNIFGQSYGGWISLSYLSLFPEGLESSRITAGLAPIMSNPDEAYERLFRVLKCHNDSFYSAHADVLNVKIIVRYLLSSPVTLENDGGYGGQLTARRFLCLGRNLGARERWGEMSRLIKMMADEILDIGKGYRSKLSDAAINKYIEEDSWKLDTRPLYAVLHEAMYCSDQASDWSAQTVAKDLKVMYDLEFRWAGAATELESNAILQELCSPRSTETIYFSGEMVYPFMFEDYSFLKPLADVAQELAKHKWNSPYDVNQLQRKNKVPVYAISYSSDMHVNIDEARKTSLVVKEGTKIEHVVLGRIPEPNSKEEEELKRTIRNREDVDRLKLRGLLGNFQHASVRSHANIVLGCMEELAKRPKKE